MSPNEILAILMVGSFLTLLIVGLPVGIAIASSALVFGYIGFGPMLFNLLPARIYGVATNYTLMAIPLFVFMGVMLERSKLAEELLDVIGHVFGGMPGGMLIATLLVGVLLSASTGIVGATIVTLGLLMLPVLIRRNYSKPLACGTIMASGTLGQIMPPCLVLILLADILGESVGTIFAAAVIPSLMLAGIYLLGLIALIWIRPDLMPPIPKEEREAMPRLELALKVVKVVFPPIFLMVAVLGSIIGGIAAPTEAASMGAIGSLLIVLLSGRLNLALLYKVAIGTLRISAMVFFILICAQAFSLAFRGLGGENLIHRMFEWLPGGVTAAIIFLMILIFVLGLFLEWIEISYVALPMFLPFFIQADVNMVWLGILVAVNLQTSFLAPPFGWALFFLKGAAPPQVTTWDTYVGAVPFVILQLLMVAVVFFYPQIALWLPKVIGW